MKRILVLGAGLVSRPGVRYLLDQEDFQVTVASRTVSKAEELIRGYPHGIARALDVHDREELTALIQTHDIVISLLPWEHHVSVAQTCLQQATPMATTSYVSDAMRSLDEEARKKGLLLLNEIGVDPGIDHMSAMRIIDQIHSEGGKILHFYSYCGGLPAPEDNDNPFGYKFSWSPKGVVLASRNPARYLENGTVVTVAGDDLFAQPRHSRVAELGDFEVYPNRDSLPYQELYGLPEASTVMRGTYRYPGWCATFKALVELGLVDETPLDSLESRTYRNLVADLIGAHPDEDLVTRTARRLDLKREDPVIQRLEWLGLFGDERLPDYDNPLDILSHRLQEKLFYHPGEKDLLLLKHSFIVENSDGSRDRITSTLTAFGIPHGDSAMARTVSLPLAVGVKLMARSGIPLTGVQIPIRKEIYEPVLRELEELKIVLAEKRVPVQSEVPSH